MILFLERGWCEERGGGGVGFGGVNGWVQGAFEGYGRISFSR